MENVIFEKKNILVTGGAGFIGSHLCERLLKEGNVICLDDFSNSDPQNINHLLQYPDFEFINWDINNPINLEDFDELNKFKIKFQGIQEIYHLACPTSPKDFEKLKIHSLHANSTAVINTLELAVKYKAKYVLGGSSVVYGDATDEKDVFKEGDLGVVNQLSPRACYDEGKRFAETCVQTYCDFYGIDAKISRIFTAYGPKMHLFQGLLIPDFIINALDNKDVVIFGDNKLSTSLCYVSDIVTGICNLMSSEPDVKVINLGSDEMYTFTQVAEMIIKMTGSKSKIVYDKPLLFLTRKGAPNLQYVRKTLGWMPLVRLEDGLEKTIEYVTANKEALLYSNNK